MVSLTPISLAGPVRASTLHTKGPQISMVGVEGKKEKPVERRTREGIKKEGPTIFSSVSLFVGYKLPNINPLSFIIQFSFFSFPKSAALSEFTIQHRLGQC